jgi:hypothetical protein
MRGFVFGGIVGSLLVAGSLVGAVSANGYGEGFSVFVPAIGTGCFGETFPVLMLVPEGGTGAAEGYGSAAPADGLPATMPPADEKATDDSGDKLLQLTSRSAIRTKVSRGEAKAIDLRGLTASDAEPMFWKGCRMYWDGQYAEALARFEAATRLQGQDARFWYFRSLAESALGQAKTAEASAKQGAELQMRGLPSQDTIRQALERVQGEPRARLRQALEAQRAAR